MSCVRKCFRSKFEMSFGPVEDVLFCLIDGLTDHLCCEW